MAKKKKASEKPAGKKGGDAVSFEDALARLEEIVRQLEGGRLGLNESLERYEEGVGSLKDCYQILQRAERKIELLTRIDADGEIETEPFDVEEDATLEDKQARRGRRRSRTAPDYDPDDVDSSRGLF